MPQLKIYKVFNRIFEVNLTKDSLGTFSCPCDVSYTQSHSNACMSNYLLFILSQNQLGITQDANIHY
jgi:hypothetical protein